MSLTSVVVGWVVVEVPDVRDARRIAILSTASGCGKTTLAKRLAPLIDAPFIELDAMVHGPQWRETPTDELLARLEPILAAERWVIDGNYRGKIGDAVVSRADVVLWLDLSIRVWLPRLVRRTARRVVTREPLWNGNRETLRGVLLGADSVLVHALRTHRSRRAKWPAELARFPLVRLRTPREVEALVARIASR
ncbi:MAG: hypothetical protein JNK05_37545 [Myxococcales bacterium]|nr:hypothetical protein [Myxococcales bacterium]